MPKKENKLRAFWSKKEWDVILQNPPGFSTRADASYLSGIFNKAFQLEMKERGYDLTTLKFEISPLLPNDRFPDLL